MRLGWLDEWLCLGPVHEEVRRKAEALLTVDARTAYDVARAEGRRNRSDARLDTFWARVAKEIARRQGRDIGASGGDRFPGPG